MVTVVSDVMEAFRIPVAALSHTVGWSPGFVRYPQYSEPGQSSTNNDVIVYGLHFMSRSTAWSYSHEDHLIQCIIWYEEKVQPLDRTLQELDKLKAYFEQPMFFAIFSCILKQREFVIDRRKLIKSVQKVDFQIGQTARYDYMGGINPWADEPVDLAQLSALISSASSLTTFLRYGLSAMGTFTSQIITENSDLSGATTAPAKLHLRKQADVINEISGQMKVFAAQLLEHSEILQERSSIQMTAVLNLITERDQHLNLSVARDSKTLALESKRDRTSMKTIAAVTMTFLPATFVASFFAMPVFNWNATGHERVVGDRFWIYWVVTVPLTLLTLGLWLLWFEIKSARERRENEAAQGTNLSESRVAGASLKHRYILRPGRKQSS